MSTSLAHDVLGQVARTSGDVSSLMLNDSALLASLSAAHLAIAFLRRHRAAAGFWSPFVLPSFMMALAPWVWSTPIGLAAGGAVHALWFLASERLAPPARRRVAAARPTPAAGPASARQPVKAAGTPAAARPAAGGFLPLPVLAVLEEATDIRTFRLSRPEGFEFTAGQFLPVRVSVDGRPHVRCYSISSSPETRGYLEISVRRQGLVSALLHATVRAGSTLTVNRPAGQFVYPGGDDRPLALVAGGIGITPLLSMLRHAVSADPARPVTLLYSARDRAALAFLNELRLIAERHPQVRIGITVSGEAAAPSPWRSGRIDAAMIRQYVPHPAHTVFCVCGPSAMMAAVDQTLRAEGVPGDQIRAEAFELAVAAASLHAAPEGQPPAGSAAPEAGEGYRVTFAASGREATASSSRTLLELADEEGVAIAASCRAGVCQACRTRLLEGEADCRSSVLDPDDRAAGFVLPCVTWAQSDCVLEA